MRGKTYAQRRISSVQFSSVAQSCPTLCDPMSRSMPGLPVHHQLPEFTEAHVHWVSDAIQPSHPLSSPSSCPQSFPASGSFQMSQLFAWGGESIGVAASTSVLLMNNQDWSPLGRTDRISLQSGVLKESSPTPQFKSINSSALSFLDNSILTSIHDSWKNHSLDYMSFVDKVMSLLFNMLSRLVITFFPRSKRLLVSWLQSLSAMILEPRKIKSETVSTLSPSICHEVIGPEPWSLNVEF